MKQSNVDSSLVPRDSDKRLVEERNTQDIAENGVKGTYADHTDTARHSADEVWIDVSLIPDHVRNHIGAVLWEEFQRFISVPENKKWLDEQMERQKREEKNR